MIPHGLPDLASSSCIPRESGDDPIMTYTTYPLPDVFPARAGMIPSPTSSSTTWLSIPRESGDDPDLLVGAEMAHLYSPREQK